MTNKSAPYFFLFLLLALTGCYRVQDKLEPQVNYFVQDKYIMSLPSSFPPLDAYEIKQEWGKEYLIGEAFARKLDLYRSVTAFKRSLILMPQALSERQQEVEYYIILCYYLGKLYAEALDAFNESSLAAIDINFATYHDLLVILYESYLNSGDKERAQTVLNIIKSHYPQTAKELELSSALLSGDVEDLKKLAYSDATDKQVNQLLTEYRTEKKSVTKAQILSTIIPGSGYLYVGQKQSALTSFLLNGLFIAAAYSFFHHGHTAAGIITLSFETGWYFGGIYGSGESAKLYNERVYEGKAFQALNDQKLFPIFLIQYGF